MSLAKIPLIALVSWAFRKCITPPNPPPPKDAQRISSRKIEAQWYARQVTVSAAYLQYLAGVAEIATILACKYPLSPLSRLVLSTLVLRGGDPTNLSLSTLHKVGATLLLLGTLIRLATFRYLGKLFVFEASVQRDHRLVTGGPYAVVRHPSYTGMMISHPGWCLWQFCAGSWVRECGLLNTLLGRVAVLGYVVFIVALPLYIVLSRMEKEDRALREHFGKEWDVWAQRVRYCVVPGAY
ncbi:hypothetical protein BDZ97DRAFT_1814404 [Flammula alnicola]|nr:hypothetical protein BDZ97DRAFT_1814404 [Flammula alnicola]